VCKDLDIKYMNAIVAEMDHGHLGQCEDNLFTGTRFVYDTIKDLYTNKDLNDCYSNYNPKAIIHKNWIEMHVPSLTNVVSFNVKNTQKIVEKFNKTVKVSIINYVKNQLNKEK